MSKRPQFSLKAILVIIAVLAVPLGMLASGQWLLVRLAVCLACPTVGACAGYLCGGAKGASKGALIGLIILVLVSCLLPTFYPSTIFLSLIQ